MIVRRYEITVSHVESPYDTIDDSVERAWSRRGVNVILDRYWQVGGMMLLAGASDAERRIKFLGSMMTRVVDRKTGEVLLEGNAHLSVNRLHT